MCFSKYINKKYILEEIGANYVHVLVPAVQCPYCKQFGGWFIPSSEKRIPNGVRALAYHRFEDTFGDKTVYFQNWITCPVLYRGLQCMVRTAPTDAGAIHGLSEYDVEGSISKNQLIQ
jgi:hypothetical protein